MRRIRRSSLLSNQQKIFHPVNNNQWAIRKVSSRETRHLGISSWRAIKKPSANAIMMSQIGEKNSASLRLWARRIIIPSRVLFLPREEDADGKKMRPSARSWLDSPRSSSKGTGRWNNPKKKKEKEIKYVELLSNNIKGGKKKVSTLWTGRKHDSFADIKRLFFSVRRWKSKRFFFSFNPAQPRESRKRSWSNLTDRQTHTHVSPS